MRHVLDGADGGVDELLVLLLQLLHGARGPLTLECLEHERLGEVAAALLLREQRSNALAQLAALAAHLLELLLERVHLRLQLARNIEPRPCQGVKCGERR